MKFSIVTTLYYSAPYIEEFYKRISASAQKITQDYEIIFVNDGSPDASLEVALNIHNQDDKVRVIDLSRNFGHYKAIFTGLSFAEGEHVFLVDCDLEERPELLEQFWEEMQKESDTDVIYGVQKERKGHLFRRLSGSLFYDVFNFLSETKIPKNAFISRLMSQRYVKNLLEYKEQEMAFDGICVLAGYKQKPVYIEKNYKGSTTYTLHKKIKIAVNFIVSFSNKPLEQIFYLGILITSFAFLYFLTIVFKKIFFGIDVEGWASLIASVWFIGGIIIFNLGIIGIYLSKIFIETKNRPYTLIKNVYSRTNKKNVQRN